MSNEHSRRGFLESTGLMVGGALGAGLTAADTAAQAQGVSAPTLSKPAQLRALLAKDEPFDVPYIPDVLCARMSEMLGFPAVFTGGNWASAAYYGVPDCGLISITELIAFGANIAEHTSLPVFADCDDGGGSPNNAYRTTRQLEQAGVAGVMYEDTAQVKNLVRGVGAVISKGEMVDKIKAAVDARRDPNFVIIARTDSLDLGHTRDEMIERGLAYVEAGADILHFSGLPWEENAKVREIVKVPVKAAPPVTATREQVKAARINLTFRHFEMIGSGAIHQAMLELKNTGMIANTDKLKLSNEIGDKLLRKTDWIARARKYDQLKP